MVSSYSKRLLLYVRWRTVAAPGIACRGRSVVALKQTKVNDLQPRYAPAVGNCSLYVCQRTVRPGHNGYKRIVDGWSQFCLFLSWPE